MENCFQSGKSNLPFSSYKQTHNYIRLAKNKELAHVVNNTDSSSNLEDINKAIANASNKDKEEAANIDTRDNRTKTDVRFKLGKTRYCKSLHLKIYQVRF